MRAAATDFGILVDTTDLPQDLPRGDTDLGILVNAQGTVATVSFVSQGVAVGDTVHVPLGMAVSPPAEPLWDVSGDALGLDLSAGAPSFVGWCAGKDGAGNGNGAIFDFADPIMDEQVTFYARWTVQKTKVTVTLDLGLAEASLDVVKDPVTNATLKSPDALSVERLAGEAYGWLPYSPQKKGWVFLGWQDESGNDVGVTSTVPNAPAVTLVGQWREVAYTVIYSGLPDSTSLTGNKLIVENVPYTDEGYAVLSWDEAAEAAGSSLSRPDDKGKVFAGWADEAYVRGEGGYLYHGGKDADGNDRDCVNLTATDGATVTLYAQWGYPPPEWKLDVTVPIEVGFGINVDTNDVVSPDMGRYAIKSRTAREVTLDAIELATKAEGGFGTLFDLVGAYTWQDAFASTTFTMISQQARDAGEDALALPLAGDENAGVWTSGMPVPDKETYYKMDAFTGASVDVNASVPLPLKLDMDIPTRYLRVKSAPADVAKLTVLKVTVSAKG